MPFVKWRRFMTGQGKGRAGFVGMLTPDLTIGASHLAAPQDLDSVLMRANTLYKDGSCLRIFATGSFAANGNNKQLDILVGTGAVNIASTGAVAGNNVNWILEAFLWRRATLVQETFSRFMHGLTPLAIRAVTTAFDEKVDNIIHLVGTAATADHDILSCSLIVEAMTV